MKENLEKFVIGSKETVYEALLKIDKNKKGFLIVVEDEKVVGTLTDGDVRRAFIGGFTTKSRIEGIFQRNFTAVSVQQCVSEVIEIFKNNAIKFLPIIDEQKSLKNIITKRQLHSLLLQDIHADLLYDFQRLDEDIVDHEVFPRPWGFYKTTVFNEYYQSKVITVYPKAELSLQSHNHREEHWIVVHGVGKVQIGDSIIDVKCGSSVFVPKGCKHRLSNIDDTESLIISEVQIGDYLGEDDIVRYEDNYGRK